MVKIRLALILISLLPTNLFAQETPKTLLWRVTGAVNPKPSYLYGTMHSRDKRVYVLGDSVYSSLENCEGFAMEIDPGEYVDTLTNSIQNQEIEVTYKNLIENDLVRKDASYYKKRQKEFDSTFEKLRQKYRDLSPQDINRLERVYKKRSKNDMKTLFDLFLFDLAKRQEKVVGGIEDIVDQTSITDELGNTFDPDEFLKNQRKKYVDVEEWMIASYTAAELDKINDFSKQNSSKEHLTQMLYNRNSKMSRRIDSLMNIRTTFFAVGVAHLPGDSGVIALLRKRGFSVTPVFSSKKIAPGDIRISNRLKSLTSITDPDSNYVVQMPGRPTIITRITDKLFVKTYKELSNEILLMHGLYDDGNINKTIDKTVDEVKAFFAEDNVKLYSVTKIVKQGIDGYDMSFKNEEGYIRMHIFYNAGLTYMFAAGSKFKDSVNAQRCTDYLSTYNMILNKAKTEVSMMTFSSVEKAFSVSMPVQPKMEHIKGDATYTKEDVTLFTGLDIRKKINFLVLIKEPFEGYFTALDSTVFKQTLTEVKTGIFQTAFVQEDIMLDGWPALKIKIVGEQAEKRQLLYAVLVLRHNRLYNLTARGLPTHENELLFDKYISSFRFLPYVETRLETHVAGNNLFSIKVPSPVRLMNNKFFEPGTANTGRKDYYSFDNGRAVTYGITSLPISKYYWANNENELLNYYSGIYFNDRPAADNSLSQDSLIYKKDLTNGSIQATELLLKNKATNSYTRLRIMHYADSVFIINCMGNKEMVTDEKADDVFNSFRFIKENYSTTAFDSKTTLLLNDLRSADSSKSLSASAALANDFRLPAQDLPVILNALLHQYPTSTENQKYIPVRLAKLVTVADENVLEFISKNYPQLKNKREDVRMLMINILSASASPASYKMLKNLLVNDAPVSGSFDIAFEKIGRSPNLAAGLFPELITKITDENIAYPLAGLVKKLIDSNKIQYDIIKEYEDQFILLSKKSLKKYQENSYTFSLPYTNALLELLVKMNTKQSKAVLSDFIDTRNIQATMDIILARIKNNIPVPDAMINEFCKAPQQRIELYDELLKMDKQAYFKGDYANQRSFAEAFTIIYTANEIPERIQRYFDIIATKDTVINNTSSRYYIFKVTCEFWNGEEYYTSIIGPFSTNPAILSIKEGMEAYILYRQKAGSKNTDILFNNFIEQSQKNHP